ncbi:hypothetical protein [Enterobacter cancerogenus]|uniref:hypothetical protein n=1 Tax=Enterobacter cancerogenus TaxID=69218 RepID=UPI001C7E0162|nr:hypothetical protein [Enterobacter cancerogenus]
MEFLEVSEGLERIELLAKVTNLEAVTDREQQVALLLIGEWARDLNVKIKMDMKKPHTGGTLSS